MKLVLMVFPNKSLKAINRYFFLILFPPQISLAIKVFGNEVTFLRLNGVDEINEAIRSFDVYNIMKSFMNGRVNISMLF